MDLASALDATTAPGQQVGVQQVLKRRAKALAKGVEAVNSLNRKQLPVTAVFAPATMGVSSEKFGDSLMQYLAADDTLDDGEQVIGAPHANLLLPSKQGARR